MKTLIKLQLRKGLLTFTVIFGAVLAAVPLALIVKAKGMSAREAVNLAMFYWAAAGIPLVALILSGIAGSEAAKEQARNTEQLLPVSQYRLLLSSLTAVLLQLGALGLVVAASMGFSLPLETLTKIQEELLNFYLFTVIYLALSGFTLSYAFSNGIAGGAVAVAAVSATLFPLVSMGEFQKLAFEIVPLWLIKPAVASMALASGALALKLLSGLGDRRVRRSALNISLIAVLLAAPVLASFSAAAWFNHAGRQVTLPVIKMFGPLYGANKSLWSARERKELADLMLVQKPFTGEVFFLDKAGNRGVVEAGNSKGPGWFMPGLNLAYGEALAAPDGEIWLLYSKLDSGRGSLLSGTIKSGFTSRAVIGRIWNMHLISGKEPGILDRREDGYYYAPLPRKNDGLKWKKVALLKDGYFSFLSAKALREGSAAAFGKNGRSLEYRGKSWALPGPGTRRLPEPGVDLADGMNFLVPVKTKDGYTTWLCRPNGKAEPIWPEYFRLMMNLTVAPDGTIWEIKETTKVSKLRVALGHYASHEYNVRNLYILTADGWALSGINTDKFVEKTGGDRGELELAHSTGDNLWFVSGSKYLVRTSLKAASDIKVWALPSVVSNRIKQVSASADGVFTAAMDGVYFTDWDGKTRKIY